MTRLATGLLALLLWALGVLPVQADEACRIAYDMGSSGIRAGADNSPGMAQIEIDFLSPLWAGRGLEETEPATIQALNDLPRHAALNPSCQRVGGGFSAWRLAQQENPVRLGEQLARIAAATGVSILVMPQHIEGRYGYRGAKKLLGTRLTTSHILDIGGGSLQIAGEHGTFGAALGQKVWHRQLCQALERGDGQPCPLSPLSDQELTRARALLSVRLLGIPKALPKAVSLTAISRPVTRGILPAVEKLLATRIGAEGIKRQQITEASERLARLSPSESAALLGTPPKYLAYLLSDLLLVEGLMRSTHADTLKIAELDLTNLPGLLADDQAYRWPAHYACYLQRLRNDGLAAYASDPASCPPGQ